MHCLTFQSTPLREGRPKLSGMVSTPIPGFNPRPCARGDELSENEMSEMSGFNPRPCARGDGLRVNNPIYSCCFNPRPCARGDYINCIYDN